MFKVNVFGKAVTAFLQALELEKAVVLEPTTNWFYRGDKTQIKTVVWGRLISAENARWVINNYPDASFVDGSNAVKGHLTLDILFVNCRPTNVVGCYNMEPDVYKRAKGYADLASKPDNMFVSSQDEVLGFEFLKELQASLNGIIQTTPSADKDDSEKDDTTVCSSSIVEERFINLELGPTQPSFEYSLGNADSRIEDTVFKIESKVVDKEAFTRTIEKLSFTSKQAAILSLVTGMDLDQLGGFWKLTK